MKKYLPYFAWVLALLGVLASVYSSEILGMEPCRLCWYQRCALFSLTLCLGIAVYRKDLHFLPYGLVLAGCGVILAGIQTFSIPSFCGASCIDKTAPLMPIFSLIVFVGIFALLWLSRKVP